MAEQDIVERLRSFNHISDAMPEAIDIIESLRDDNAGLFRRIAELDAENASLRQQLADARETAAKIAYDAQAEFERQASTNDNPVAHDALLMASDALELVGDAILAHPDREGERPSETETAARIVDTQAQYYAGHNEDVAKALRDAAGAIRAQARPRCEGERG